MIGKGRLTSVPRRRLGLLIAAHLLWLGVVSLLGAWWVRLVLSQAEQISELKKAAGMAAGFADSLMAKTQRMIFWESSTYALLLFGSSLLILGLYWKESARSRSVQAFFASMTHELRTPLSSIRLQAESVAETLPAEIKQRTFLNRLIEDTQRLENQVERTLELARVEGGGTVFTESLDFVSWFQRMQGQWREAYGVNLLLHVDIASLVDAPMRGDQTALSVIFRNLLENSFRHSKGTSVEVTVAGQKVPEGIQLSFKDAGASFEGDRSRLGRIFEKGSRSSGAGVGLYLIHILMKQMGGSAHFLGGPGFEVQLRFPSG